MKFVFGVYNELADIISILKPKWCDTVFQRYTCFLQDRKRKEGAETYIKSILPEIFVGDESNKLEINIPGDSNVKEEFISKLHGFIIEHSNDTNLLILLLNYIDRGIYKLRERWIAGKYDFFEIDGLNSNYKDNNILILPRYYCSWEHKNRGRRNDSSLNKMLYYTYFVDLRKNDKYQIKNIIFQESVFSRIIRHKKVTLGVSPITNKATLEISKSYDSENEVNRFNIDGVAEKKEINQKILDIINLAAKKKIDILVFPEMLGSEEILLEMNDKLRDIDAPIITVLPSVWKNERNQSIVVDSVGDEICRQDKHKSYDFTEDGKTYFENINSSNTIHILHCYGLGRIVIAICKDFLDKTYVDYLISDLHATLILSPSFSTGVYDFEQMIPKGASYDCNTVWVNTCSAQNFSDDENNNFNTIAAITTYGVGKNTSKFFTKDNEIVRDKLCNQGLCSGICLKSRQIEFKK